MALNQHLLPPSDKTTRLLASHNQRILWEWISWSTSSDFSRIWFSFKMNPLDWTYESNKQRHYSGLFLGHFWVNILTHQYLRVTILSSNVVTSGWQMRTDYFQTSLFLALIMTDKPRQNLTDFVNLQICGWSPDFRDGGEIAENLHFLISQLSAAVHRALCRIFASGSGHQAGELRVAEKKSEILWREILCRPGLQPRSCHEGDSASLTAQNPASNQSQKMQNTGHFSLAPRPKNYL